MLTRKHYNAIAKAIKESTCVTTIGKIHKNTLIKKLITIFSEDNPHFNQNKFLNAVKTPFDEKGWLSDA